MSDVARLRTVVALGVTQTLGYASSYYLPAILVRPMAADIGVSPVFLYAALSGALVVAGLVGPRVGALIDQFGGRGLLGAANCVLCLGLLLLAGAHGPVGLVSAWLVLGLGMGMGLYDAAFATLVRLYGAASRRPITGITLIAGFASTIGWPITDYLEARHGWRLTCVVWGCVHLLVALPLNLTLPKIVGRAPPAAAEAPQMEPGARRTWAMAVLAFVFTANALVSSGMSALLPAVLERSGVAPASAIFAAALVGPAQVAARIAEMGWLARFHPLVNAKLAVAMTPLGVAAFLLGGPVLAPLFTTAYGLGNGMITIIRGTLPLAMFGAGGFGRRQGLIVMPARFAGAASPLLVGLAMERLGSSVLLAGAAASLAALAGLLALGRIGVGARP